MVAPEDEARAAAILDEMEEEPAEEAPFEQPPARSNFLSGFVWGILVASFFFLIFGASL